METEVRRQCAAEVGDGTGWHWDPCRNPGKVKDGGKWWCGVHDPIKKREREEARSAAFNTRIERMGERGRRAEAYPELLKALKAAYPVLESMPLGVADQEVRDEHAQLLQQVGDAIAKAELKP